MSPKQDSCLPATCPFFKKIFIYFNLAQLVKNPRAMGETRVQSQGGEDPLEEGRATHSSILAWRMPRLVDYSPLEEPGGLQSMESQKNGTQLDD